MNPIALSAAVAAVSAAAPSGAEHLSRSRRVEPAGGARIEEEGSSARRRSNERAVEGLKLVI